MEKKTGERRGLRSKPASAAKGAPVKKGEGVARAKKPSVKRERNIKPQ